MKNVICCENGNHENLKVCNNCGIENFHYYKDNLQDKKDILICSFCIIDNRGDKWKLKEK